MTIFRPRLKQAVMGQSPREGVGLQDLMEVLQGRLDDPPGVHFREDHLDLQVLKGVHQERPLEAELRQGLHGLEVPLGILDSLHGLDHMLHTVQGEDLKILGVALGHLGVQVVHRVYIVHMPLEKMVDIPDNAVVVEGGTNPLEAEVHTDHGVEGTPDQVVDTHQVHQDEMDILGVEVLEDLENSVEEDQNNQDIDYDHSLDMARILVQVEDMVHLDYNREVHHEVQDDVQDVQEVAHRVHC